jgi:hypothetical protein
MDIKAADKAYVVNQGETILLHRHLLARFTKAPSESEQFKSISILFSQPFLQKFYALNEPEENIKHEWQIKPIDKHPLLISLFDSILPYYEIYGDKLPEHLAEIKLQEAITILRAVDISSDSILSNFAEPGKIDLAEFMAPGNTYVLALTKSQTNPYTVDYEINSFFSDAHGKYSGQSTGLVKSVKPANDSSYQHLILIDKSSNQAILIND